MKTREITISVILAIFLSTLFIPSQAQDAREIYMEGYDNMKFSVETITAKAGETITVTLKTISDLAKVSMAHNFVLLKKDTDVEAFVLESIQHREEGYIAPDLTGQIIAQTGMLGADEKDSVTFTVPEEAGEYVYVCTFPGHYHAGMKGVLTVK